MNIIRIILHNTYFNPILMTGALGTIMDNFNRNQSNRREASRWKDFHERIRKANSPKPKYDALHEQETPELVAARQKVLFRIRNAARTEKSRERKLLLWAAIAGLLIIVVFYFYWLY